MTLLSPVMKRNIFSVEAITEPLASATITEVEKIQKYFDEYKYDVVGLEENDRIIGYVEKKESIQASINAPKRFDLHDLITPNTDLKVCLKFLEKRSYLFVMDQSEVTGIVTKADRQKPAVRMMFFGIITVFESQVASLIHERYPKDSWKSCLSEGRMDKAKNQYKELIEKNLEVELIHSTHLCDKTAIILKSSELLKEITDLEKKEARSLFYQLEQLRNSLAHAHSLQHWFEEKNVVKLAEDIDEITRNIEKSLNKTT